MHRCYGSARWVPDAAVAILAFDEPKEIPLWPNGAPGSEGKTDKEFVARARAASAALPCSPSEHHAVSAGEGENHGTAVIVIRAAGTGCWQSSTKATTSRNG